MASEPPGRRAALLLSWAVPGADPSGLSAGQENDRLLRLYQQAFGPALAGVVECPGCGEPLDVTIDVEDLIRGIGAGPGSAGPGPGPGFRESSFSGHVLRFRVPSALDLALPPESALDLLAACLAGATGPDGSEVAAWELPPGVVSSLEAAMDELDPGAELSLSMTCPGCGLEWAEYLDPVEFLSVEVEARAREAVEAVHTLAAAYGWSEPEILALSPWRMRLYLATASR